MKLKYGSSSREKLREINNNMFDFPNSNKNRKNWRKIDSKQAKKSLNRVEISKKWRENNKKKVF